MMFDTFKNIFLNKDRYKTNSEAVIISCFYNPSNSPYRLLAFQKWYHSIKHLNHRIIECTIGEQDKPQLPESEFIEHIHTESLLWHKESLLNNILKNLPEEFRYVFWVDADVLFTNNNWLTQGAEALQKVNIIQPFEYCIHLDKNQTKPSFDVNACRGFVNDVEKRNKSMWRSFCANHVTTNLSSDNNYDIHGHVGFAWGARREVLDKCPLYDKALIGGADHILAHAAAGQIPHNCITKSFTDNLDEVLEWSRKFYSVVQGKIGYVGGNLYHIWHGDIKDRQYYQRIKEFTEETKQITEKDQNGLYKTKSKNKYMKKHTRRREVTQIYDDGFDGFDDGFYADMGYTIFDIYQLFGQPSYDDDDSGDFDDAPVAVAQTEEATQNFS
jgi:hypothetical protein